MVLKHVGVALLCGMFTAVPAARAADSHRVLVLDIGRHENGRPGLDHRRASGELAGPIEKIDLAADPPKIVQTSETRVSGHGAGFTVSQRAGAVLMATHEPPLKGMHPPDRVQSFGTSGLELQREFALSLTTADARNLWFLPVEASRDGKYLYALGPEAAKLAVIEIASGREIKVLDAVGKYPLIMIALPERSGQ